ncbi:hypothetical protein [Pelosinus sp. sgz500959]|uniref:hypothetical protein n=1 Tax=Pelosinus sp. sgz500959 TaxID=3242472 RepID=UPI00366E9E33
MTDIRLDRMEKMMEQLIGMAANNNSTIDGMRTDLTALKDDVAILKEDFIRLENKVDMLYKEQQEDIKIILQRMATKDDIDKVVATQQLHTDWLRKLSADSIQHELEINQLKIAR